MTTHTVTYDPTVKALYIELTDHVVAETIELSRSVYVDVDALGEPVGFEILNASPALVESLAQSPSTLNLKQLMEQSAA